MNIYDEAAELRLDERELSERLAISRTPLREALARLEQEGLVKIVPRRGVYIVRKTKDGDRRHDQRSGRRLKAWRRGSRATLNATDEEIGAAPARCFVDQFSQDDKLPAGPHGRVLRREHRPFIRRSSVSTKNHMRSAEDHHRWPFPARPGHPQPRTIFEKDNRAKRSIADHKDIIEALEEPAYAELRRAALSSTTRCAFADHIEKYVDHRMITTGRRSLPGRCDNQTGLRPKNREADMAETKTAAATNTADDTLATKEL